MALKHNKKRNSGMMSDFFAKYISESFIERNKESVDVAKGIWSRYTSSKTELRKEMKLFEVLTSKKFDNNSVAHGVIQEVKKVASKINHQKLENEKTALIREVNNKLSSKFYEHSVDNYVDLASIQIFLNHHISKNLNESIINPAILELEDKIVKFMCNKSINEELARKSEDFNKLISGEAKTEVDGLVVNIMREKLNKKFGDSLNESQKNLLQKYVYGNNLSEVEKMISDIKFESLSLIEEELKSGSKKTPKKKLLEIKGLIEEDYSDTKNPEDSTVTFYMMLSNLNEELKSEDDGKVMTEKKTITNRRLIK